MKQKLAFLALLFVLLTAGSRALAQGCSICTKTASELDNRSARGLNLGIVYLALLPLGAMGTIGFIWWRRNRAAVGE